jgi:glycosyltransferase involved in cell wall biosynthesis
MFKVLISAYACGPDIGSEAGVGWNWITNLASHCKVFVITEGEWKDEIDTAMKKLPQGRNLKFYYNPVSERVRKMCWNQGDYRFYYFYRKWQQKAFTIAKQIIAEQKIDIVHQLNMIGFREPGYLWKIENLPFVWGPVGGFNFIPIRYLPTLGINNAFFYLIKNILNYIQINTNVRVRKAVNKASLILAASKDTKYMLNKFFKKDSILFNETGCHININGNVSDSRIIKNQEEFHILWVGRFIPTKLLSLALKTISEVKHLKGINFSIVGGGLNSHTIDYFKRYATSLGIQNQCKWHGKISRNEVDKIMKDCDLFFFTSIAEATSTVVMEAITNLLPILCFDICGHGEIVNNEIGMKIPLENPAKSIKQFAQKIEYLYKNRNVLKEMSLNCHVKTNELSWNAKGEKLFRFYQDLVK